MKFNQKFLRIGIVAFLFLSIIGVNLFSDLPVRASPADDFWVNGIGNWSDATNHWATTSGGSPNSANEPTASTNVHFDANSFSANGQFVVLDVTAYCNNMDWSGVTHSNIALDESGYRMYVYGNLILNSSVNIYNDYGSTYFTFMTSGGTQNITSNGGTFGDLAHSLIIDFEGSGGTINLADNLTGIGSITSLYIQNSNVIFNTNNHNITMSNINIDSGSTVNLGSSTISCRHWSLSGVSNLNAGTSTINDSGDFQGNGATYNNVNITGASTISGNNTFNNLNIARTAGTVQFTASSTQTCTTFTAPLSGTTNLNLTSTSLHTAWNLIQASGTVNTDYVTMSDSHATGGANFYAGVHSTDVSGNSGWLFQTPPTITTSTANPVTGASANLQGTIDIFGGYSPIYVSFNYATDAYYSGHGNTYSDSTAEQTFTTQAVPITVQQQINYLLATTEYHFQMQVRWVQGGNNIYEYGSDATFVTTNYPYAETLDATGITSSTATLNGNLLSIGNFTFASGISVYFRWGSTTSYGNTTSPVVATALGTFSVPLTTSDGIQNGQTYHYQAVVTYNDVSSPQTGADVQFTVGLNGSLTITIENVGIFHNYLTNSPTTYDTLVVMEVVDNYSTVFKSKTASNCFEIQLLDTDNATILGVGMLQQWGDRPESIYLNSTVTASKIVDGSAYYIKVIGYNVSGNPSEEYLVQSADWYGSDLTQLDNLLFRIGNVMALTDTTTYTTVLADGHSQITDNAVGFFVNGIPDITNIRPNDFTSSTLNSQFPSTSANNQWDSNTAWTTNVGTNISSDATIMSAPFGITGKDFLATVIWLFVLAVIGYTVSQGGKPLPALLLCMPIIWLGTYWKILPVQQLIVICIIFFFFGVRQFFIKTT